MGMLCHWLSCVVEHEINSSHLPVSLQRPASITVLEVRVPPREVVVRASKMELLLDFKAELDSLFKK